MWNRLSNNKKKQKNILDKRMHFLPFSSVGGGCNWGVLLYKSHSELELRGFYLQGWQLVSLQLCGYIHIVSWVSHAWDIHETAHQWNGSREMRCWCRLLWRCSLWKSSSIIAAYSVLEAVIIWDLDNLVACSQALCLRLLCCQSESNLLAFLLCFIYRYMLS